MNGIRGTFTHLKTLHMCWYSFNIARKCHQNIPFLELHERITGQSISKDSLPKLKKKHPHIDTLSYERLECTLQILSKFGITAIEACKDPHVFSMNPITLDNYGMILKECGFIQILPIHIIKYHTFVRSKTIAQLKKQGFISENFCLESNLLDYFKEWIENKKCLYEFPESKTSILIVRMSVLERYLKWKLNVTPDQFKNYCRNYLPLKHKPMSDIKKSLYIAQNEIKFDNETIRRNGFIISSDPLNTTLIIDNVPTLAGLDIRDAVKLEPAILKTNYNSLITIKNILEDYRISDEMQRKCLRVYCMNPQTVRERLKELEDINEFKILSTNPRVLYMVVHHKKMMMRLDKIKETKKKSFCLNNLVASDKVFNHYINSFGDKSCSRDIVTLINSTLKITKTSRNDVCPTQPELKRTLYKQLKRHKYWLHTALNVVNDNLYFLKSKFGDRALFNNCQLLLYPVQEVENYINLFLTKREGNTDLKISEDIQLDVNYNVINYSSLTDDQLLSLVVYEIEKKYYFSGDGIWTRQDGVKMEAQIGS